MSAVGLIPLASLMIDVMVLGQLLPARASEKNLLVAAAPAATRGSYILLAAEEPVQNEHSAAESKTQSEQVAAVGEKTPAKPAEAPPSRKSDAVEPRAQKQPSASNGNPEKEKSAAEPPISIIKMLEGHEKELLAATVIAAAFFSIGWICGGNYYLRRDRRRRTKLRF